MGQRKHRRNSGQKLLKFDEDINLQDSISSLDSKENTKKTPGNHIIVKLL